MISGIEIKQLTTHCDDRGMLREVLRDDDGMLERFGQCTVTRTYPGVIKAFHWHREQDDVWHILSGMARIVLHDLRSDSDTHGQTDVIVAGDDNPLTLLIPAGVAHGYQVLGNRPVLMMYLSTRSYNREAPDEERLPWDDPGIGFDWSIRNR